MISLKTHRNTLDIGIVGNLVILLKNKVKH